MERVRKPRVSNIHEVVESDNGPDTKLGCRSITELPKFVFLDILIKLSVNMLLVCRCVCKTWRSLISDPEFGRFHYLKLESCVPMKLLSRERSSETLLLIEPPGCNFNYGYRDCQCYDNGPLCDKHFKNVLSTKLLQHEVGPNRQLPMDAKAEYHRFGIVNSCHGFLCLSEPLRNDPVAVCNPILGEYVHLPVPTEARLGLGPEVDCALGFSPRTKQYKVIRMFWKRERGRSHVFTLEWDNSSRNAEIHTLGTSSWRNIEEVPYTGRKLGFPTYVNGALFWLNLDDQSPDKVVSFDFVSEKFQRIQSPQEVVSVVECWNRYTSLGEFRGCLSMCCSYSANIVVWVMKDSSDHGSWMKQHCLTTRISSDGGIWGLFQPISVSSDGSLLLYHHSSSGLLHYHPNGSSHRYLEMGLSSKFNTITFRPSFISLKDVATGESVVNLHSRGAPEMLQEGTSTVSLGEVSADIDKIAEPFTDDDLREDEFSPTSK